jgi:hypothetical protein
VVRSEGRRFSRTKGLFDDVIAFSASPSSRFLAHLAFA